MSNFGGWTHEDVRAAQERAKANPKSQTPTQKMQSLGRLPGGVIADIMVGIDPGTHTGFAVKYCWETPNVWKEVSTLTIFEAMQRLQILNEMASVAGKTIFVRFEDARLRTYFGKSGPEKWKGAGSIMRDCNIWEEMLTYLKIPFEKVHPKNVKETDAKTFKGMTGWKGRTSIHAREAAWQIL